MLKHLTTNPILLTDSYNLSHQRLKCNTDWEISHLYNRRAGMILYGLREMALQILETRFTHEMIDEAIRQTRRQRLPFPEQLWRRVVMDCGGYVPLKFESLPEGTWCPAGTPFAQIRDTVEGFGELVTWWEGVFMHAYFPCECATTAFLMRQYLEQKQKQYGFDDTFLWRLHSFGFRGHRSLEDAYWAGTAWNLSLHGTDDFHTSVHNPNATIGSIAALAHKVTQQYDHEFDCFVHAIKSTAQAGEKIVALVIDTYDANRVIHVYLQKLITIARDFGVRIVLRPDSGDVLAQAIEIYHVTKEYDAFDVVSVIIGEGMNFDTVRQYDERLEAANVPLNFVFYGVGGGFYNASERDNLGFAMKTAYSNGADRMKFAMNPLKQSIPGAVKIVKEDGQLVVRSESEGCALPTQYEVFYLYKQNGDRVILQADETHWLATQKRMRKQQTTQTHIVLSDAIQRKIAALRVEHVGND